MSQRCETAPVETLLEHAEWVRRLAAHLVRGDPEDAVQDSWLATLRSPPDPSRPPRPWLARVLKNAARKHFREEASRRAREEKAGALPESVPTPGDLLERAEASRLLSDLVLALDEPLRQVVLLRYYEGLSSAEIARTLGVPAGTVRWRLKEAIDRLRAALDARHGGDRNAWCLLLAPTALAHSGATLPAGAAAMALTAKLAVVGAVAVLAGVFGWALQVPPAGPPTSSSQQVAPPSQPLPAGAPGPAASERSPASREEEPRPEPAPPKALPEKPKARPQQDLSVPAPPPLTPAEQARRRHAAEDALDTMMEGPAEPEPVDWPNEVPEAYRPERFQAIVSQILRDCSVPAELVKVECDEPPCIAVLRLRDQPAEHEILGDCPLWQQSYGSRTAINQSHKTVACADGGTERAAFVYRFWPALYDEHCGYLLRRIRERVKALRDHWECLP